MTTTATNQLKIEWLRLKIRCNGQNFGIKVKPWTQFRKVKKRFSIRSGKPKSSFLLAYQGKEIQANDTPLTLGLRMTKTRIKIAVVDLPSIDEYDLIGLFPMFSIKDLNGLSQLAMNSRKTWTWSNHRTWHTVGKMRNSKNTNCLNNEHRTGVTQWVNHCTVLMIHFKDYCKWGRMDQWNNLIQWWYTADTIADFLRYASEGATVSKL